VSHPLQIEPRVTRGKSAARRLRAEGRVPAILYGHGVESRAIALDPRALEKLLRASDAGLNTLIDLESKARPDLHGKVALVKELQRDPLSGLVLHADLYEVNLSEKVRVTVPIELEGTPEGVSLQGGILEHSLREVDVECLPRAIPDVIRADVSRLNIGEGLHVSDLVLPEGVELLSDPALSVATVVAPKAEEEAAPAAAAAVEGAPAEGAAAPAAGEAKAESE
jgi:large subunit ribosomal protein L25